MSIENRIIVHSYGTSAKREGDTFLTMAKASTEILLIHLGGLGDICLSESTFASVSRGLGDRLVGLAYPRLLRLFKGYFRRIEDAGSPNWTYLFADSRIGMETTAWQRIIFIGKDRSGRLRKRWQRFSLDPLLFVEMYPEEDGRTGADEKVHVETFQLRQLSSSDFEAMKKEVVPVPSQRIVLYPEQGFRKRKWPIENFLDLREALTKKGLHTTILSPSELHGNLPGSMVIDDLTDLAVFLRAGGIFVSNDCGVAHLAGTAGMRTLTIFHEYDPYLWHPRGSNVSIRCPDHGLSPRAIETDLLAMLGELPSP